MSERLKFLLAQSVMWIFVILMFFGISLVIYTQFGWKGMVLTSGMTISVFILTWVYVVIDNHEGGSRWNASSLDLIWP